MSGRAVQPAPKSPETPILEKAMATGGAFNRTRFATPPAPFVAGGVRRG